MPLRTIYFPDDLYKVLKTEAKRHNLFCPRNNTPNVSLMVQTAVRKYLGYPVDSKAQSKLPIKLRPKINEPVTQPKTPEKLRPERELSQKPTFDSQVQSILRDIDSYQEQKLKQFIRDYTKKLRNRQTGDQWNQQDLEIYQNLLKIYDSNNFKNESLIRLALKNGIRL